MLLAKVPTPPRHHINIQLDSQLLREAVHVRHTFFRPISDLIHMVPQEIQERIWFAKSVMLALGASLALDGLCTP